MHAAGVEDRLQAGGKKATRPGLETVDAVTIGRINGCS